MLFQFAYSDIFAYIFAYCISVVSTTCLKQHRTKEEITCLCLLTECCYQTESESRPARLFHCSNASGSFRVVEVLDFVQVCHVCTAFAYETRGQSILTMAALNPRGNRDTCVMGVLGCLIVCFPNRTDH